MDNNKDLTIRFSIPNLLTLLVFGFACFVLYQSRQVILTSTFGVLLAYLVNPLVERMIKRGIHRIFATITVLVLAIFVIFLIAFWVVPELIKDIEIMMRNIPSYIESITLLSMKLAARFDIDLTSNAIYTYLIKWVSGSRQEILSWLGGIMGSLKYAVGFTMNLILIPILAFILLLDYPKLGAFTDKYIGTASKLRYVVNLFGKVMSSYFRGQLTVVLILAVLYSLALYIAGVDAALLLGIMTGLLSIVPYLGFTVGIVLSLLVTLIQFHDIWHLVYVGIGYTLVQALESFVITPRIVGDSVGLHPAATMIVLLMGGSAFGLIGMLFAIPFSAIIFRLYKFKHQTGGLLSFTNVMSPASEEEQSAFEKILHEKD